MNTITGGCRCGQVRYVLTVDKLPRSYACHCLDCQTWTGVAFSQSCVFPGDVLSVSGDVAIYELAGSAGRVSRQRICPTCHTRVYNTNTGHRFTVLRAGTLDRSDELDCVAHMWTRRKQAWIALPPDIPTWHEGPGSFDELARALGLTR
ncbi:GFA family protein [Luteibacter sp. NPDC031894]|uniref:GFA family protein n=1 Tax=Luteibacter sp. NPDC031894 TaxID=3390572 RepID=UPI003CFEE12A